MIYEFITPSDPITFTAPNDAIATAAAIIVGSGKAFCTSEDGTKLNTSFLFASKETIEASIHESLGTDIYTFIDANALALADTLESFSYGNFAGRRAYDAAIAAITDPDKLATFKAFHEDQNRTSMSEWVAYAWKRGASLRQSTPTPA
jgi:hypothetical protein